jgi:hypothetical protein
MTLEQYAYLAEIIGMAIVVVTLIFLVLQMRQNTRTIQGSTIDSVTQTQQAELRWSSDISDVFSKAIERPTDLDSSEAWKMSEWLISAMAARQNEFLQFKRRHLDPEEWKAFETIILVILSLPWARNWWKTLGHKVFHADFVGLVNELYERDVVLVDWESTLADLKAVSP